MLGKIEGRRRGGQQRIRQLDGITNSMHMNLSKLWEIVEFRRVLFRSISWSLLKFMSIESVMLSNYLILCHPLLLLPSIFPSISIFSNELALHIRWPKYWSFSFTLSPSNEYSWLISFWIDCPRDSQESSQSTVQKHQFFGAQPSLWSNSHIHT